MCNNKARIVIVGAGIAGLACANQLHSSGFFDVILLEATNRIGGRIHSISVGDDDDDTKVELGANYILGIDRNPMYQIAESQNLLRLRNCDNNLLNKNKVLYLRENGEKVSEKIVKDVDWDYAMLMQKCEDFFIGNQPPPVWANSNVGDFMKREFERRHLIKYKSQPEICFQRSLVFNQRLIRQCVLAGCNDMREVSLEYFGSYEELPGIQYVIPPGIESVVNTMCDIFPQDKIHLNRVVSCINWDYRPLPDSKERKIIVTCENGEEYVADHVVVTVSLGFLKENYSTLFYPPLPQYKQQSIEILAFGLSNKVALVFESPVVASDIKRLELMWEEKNLDEEVISNCWTRMIPGFDVIKDNILLAQVPGRAAAFMEELTDDDLNDTIRDVLKQFLTLDCEQNGLESDTLPPTLRVIRSQWMQNRFTRGSYSYLTVGNTVEDITRLTAPLCAGDSIQSVKTRKESCTSGDSSGKSTRKPVVSFSTKDIDDFSSDSEQSKPKPLVLFAGEATHRKFYSTTHGALLTGLREASRIESFWNGTDLTLSDDEDDLEESYNGFSFHVGASST